MSPSYKTIFEAADLLKIAQEIAANARNAAMNCDVDRARRLRKKALKAIQKTEDRLSQATLQERDFYATDDNVERLIDHLRDDMDQVKRQIKACKPSTKYPFKKSGSFGKTKDMQTGRNGQNTIELEFAIKDDLKCEKLCLISVYYIEEDATGKKLDKPSRGYKKDFDNAYGGALPDTDAADGYIIDAPRMVDPKTGRLRYVPNNSPCMPTSKIVGKTISAEDSPYFVRKGFTAYFETCLVCLDDRPKFRIFGCIKWVNKGTKTKIKKRKGKTDRKSASEGFIRALELYLANHP